MNTKRGSRSLTLALLLATIAVAVCESAPQGVRPEDYPVKALFNGTPAKPKFDPGRRVWDQDPKFRAQVEFAVSMGPDFAGAYRLIAVSCGTGCGYYVVADVRSGQLYENLPFKMVVLDGPGDDYHPAPMYRLNSRLLEIEGYVDESGVATRTYYEWTGSAFRMVKRIRLRGHG